MEPSYQVRLKYWVAWHLVGVKVQELLQRQGLGTERKGPGVLLSEFSNSKVLEKGMNSDKSRCGTPKVSFWLN